MRARDVVAMAACLGLAMSSSACAPVPTRVSGELAWTRADTTSVRDMEEMPVTPGEVVRLASDRPVPLVSVVRTPQGDAEIATTIAPKEGVVLVRPALGTTALRFPRGIVAHAGAARDPEIDWFDLESEALAWARSPLGTAFPALAAAPRIDVGEIAEVDAALLAATAGAKDAPADPTRGDSSTAAIRSLVALRAVRALEGVRAYPYARNGDVPFTTSGRTRQIQSRTFVEVLPGHSARVSVDGPTTLAVWSRVIRGAADVVGAVRVREDGRLRGESRALVRRLAPDVEQVEGKETTAAKTTSLSTSAAFGPVAEVDPTLAPLRRVTVHVPPGAHAYDIEVIGGAAWIAATDTSAFQRVEDAVSGAKSERRLAAEATAACSAPGLHGATSPRGNACALALALTGGDAGPRFERAIAAASPAAQRIVQKLAAGAPSDRAARLESDAGTGDDAALATLGHEAASTVDASFRDAWWRGTLRGSSWQTVDDGSPPTWFAFLPREGAQSTCGARAAAPAAAATAAATSAEHDLDTEPLTVFSAPWRRVRAIRLLAVAPCTASGPIQLEVDGETLSAQPSSGRAIWHVVVRGETARVRRLDRGGGHIYALSDDACSGHGSLVHAAAPLTDARALVFPPRTSAPGVEVWLKEAASAESFHVGSADGRERLDVVAHPAPAGLVAIDERGTRWRRAATIGLPSWVLDGARATGSPNVALRLVARGMKSSVDAAPVVHAAPPNVEALVAASRRLLAATTPEARASAALERAFLLASYGAERAALEDAELAKSYAPAAPSTDPVAAVRRAILPLAPAPLEVTTTAYGIEPDFDPHAARCATSPGGPRARVAALDASLRQRGKGATFDRALAVQAATVAEAAPQDPRSETLIALATASSKWHLLRDVEGGGGRVPRPHEKEGNPVLDADARLRPRLYAGDPFGASFVTVSPDRPARAFVADLGSAKARLDVVCVPRRATAAGDRCPLDVKIGDLAVLAKIGEDGRATIDLPHGRGRGKGAELAVSLGASRGDYVALIRIVFDARVPGATFVKDVGWVLETPHIQYRFLVAPARPIRIHPAAPALMRIDAVPEPGETVTVVASAGGRDVTIPASGEPKLVPLATAGDVVVTARGGTATVAIAERIDDGARSSDEEVDPRGATVRQVDVASAQASLADGAWRDVAERSPPPLTWLEDRLGTLESSTGVVASSLREGAAADTAPDAYAFESLAYRRRIESLNLFSLVSGLVRARDGAPTYGGAVTLYEDSNATRLRLTGTGAAFAQNVGGETAYTVTPRGFIEYSGRVTSDFYILPRVGFDGYYTSLASRPASSKVIDDDVYNAFRFQRNSLAFLQGLFWYVPFFNQIVYARLRGTYDLTNGAFSHASVRPGTFLIFHAVELGAFADAQYFERTTAARSSSGVDFTGGAAAILHLPVSAGSFELRPNVSAQMRGDGGYQIFAALAVIASYRRGARDYSSLELSFPEETSGGVPWRTESRGP